MTNGRRVVGLFAEGSQPTDPRRDDFARLWTMLADHCDLDVDVRVIGITKAQLVPVPAVRAAATQLAKRRTQLVSGREPLDLTIERARQRYRLDRVVIAFDRWPANQALTAEEARYRCPMRPEVAVVLRMLARSTVLSSTFRDAARVLLARYESQETLTPRINADGLVEVVFMDPMFEAIFVHDEATVRRALEVDRKPKDWPKFNTTERDLGKRVLDVAIEAAKHRRGAYTAAKALWGRRFVEAALPDSELWNHPVTERLCKALAA